MRRSGWLILGLALALAVGREAPAAVAPSRLGADAAYETLGKLAVMHQGRVKPLDTQAREEVKQIFGREAAIQLRDASGKVVESWGPVAALYDWGVRPEFWDDQSFILVDYLPLKRLILADAIQARLKATADKPATSAADRAALRALADDKELTAAALNRFVERSRLPQADRGEIARLAIRLGEGQKWLTPREIEGASVVVGGERLAFDAWIRDVAERKNQAENNALSKGRLTTLEDRAYDVGVRLRTYQAARDRDMRAGGSWLVVPRPSNKAYLEFTAKALEKGRGGGFQSFDLLETEAASALVAYWDNLQSEDRKVPGKDDKADLKFASWLDNSSTWIALEALLKAKPDELKAAGFPEKETGAFLEAFRALEQAESSSPGRVSEAQTSGLVSAARTLGQAVSKVRYPAPREIERETYFNEHNPFFIAPGWYGAAMALLALSLGLLAVGTQSLAGKASRVVYGLGLLALAAGIGLEVFGFYLRVRISSWAPVTNMYETVIWVALVSAVLALIFELIYRKTYAALAGSAVALLGTVLAANVPLLDPHIRPLQPVLRSNYWLTIHVLTEVSSYAAFALAMGLGMIATLYYLTATYRRSPGFAELAKPLVPGLPLLAAGSAGLAAAYGLFGAGWVVGSSAFYASMFMAGLGGVLALTAIAAVAGEAVNRLTFHDGDLGVELSEGSYAPVPAATAVQTVTVTESRGAVATLARPTIAEIRAREASGRPKLDARGLAMQATAAQIKPLANFIYRTMQVGVLLIAAGTILGGVWADYSWGRFWGWDPKEVWALITLLVYLVPLHGRFAGWVNTFTLVCASVVCFLSVIMAWYGVNFVLGVGLHSYGFTEGGGQGIVSAVVLAVLAIPAAAAWRRRLASRRPGDRLRVDKPMAAETPPERAWDVACRWPAQGHWSEEEYLALNTNGLVEFSGGHVEVLPPPTMSHQLMAAFLYGRLFAFVAAHGLGTVLFAPLRVRLWPSKFRVPDVLFMRSEHASRCGEQYWDGADLVMEIVSDDDRRRDLETKRREYAQAGIPEYWIVDPREGSITVLRLDAGAYIEHGVFRRGEQAASALLPGFVVEVDAALAPRG